MICSSSCDTCPGDINYHSWIGGLEKVILWLRWSNVTRWNRKTLELTVALQGKPFPTCSYSSNLPEQLMLPVYARLSFIVLSQKVQIMEKPIISVVYALLWNLILITVVFVWWIVPSAIDNAVSNCTATWAGINIPVELLSDLYCYRWFGNLSLVVLRLLLWSRLLLITRSGDQNLNAWKRGFCAASFTVQLLQWIHCSGRWVYRGLESERLQSDWSLFPVVLQRSPGQWQIS